LDLSKDKKYDGVVFHRVIDGFMAQTGDVQFGNSNLPTYDLKRAGTGGSEYPDLKAEFSELPHERGTLSMARSADPNSANSQFFICFKPAPFLDRQYTIFGKVIEGMDFVDLIKKGEGSNGEVSKPDKIISLFSK
jgi:cyclophilin family peptidyl-prolyl cis-trans isomerase